MGKLRTLGANVITPIAMLLAASLAIERLPPDPGDKYYRDTRRRIREYDVILLGNSVLDEGVSTDILKDAIDRSVLKAWSGGAASAWWYLVLKNGIAGVEPKPDCVAICFRDAELTLPGRRVLGVYAAPLEEVSTAFEPEFERLAFPGRWQCVTLSLRRFWALYRFREHVRDGLEDGVKDVVCKAMGEKSRKAYSRAGDRIFSDRNMISGLLEQSISDAEDIESDAVGDAFDFQEQVAKSFLPLMIAVAREHDLNLVFIRMKRRPGYKGEGDPRLLRYVDELRAYLGQRNVPFIDFGDAPGFGQEHFNSGDHLGGKGRRFFTPMLAEELCRYVSPQRSAQGGGGPVAPGGSP